MGKRGPAPQLTDAAPTFLTADIAPPPDLITPCDDEKDEMVRLRALHHWNRYAPALASRNVLTIKDVPAFEMQCWAYAEWQVLNNRIRGEFTIERRNAPAKNPLCTLRNQSADLSLRLLKAFGMTPDSLGNLTFTQTDDNDSLADDLWGDD